MDCQDLTHGVCHPTNQEGSLLVNGDILHSIKIMRVFAFPEAPHGIEEFCFPIDAGVTSFNIRFICYKTHLGADVSCLGAQGSTTTLLQSGTPEAPG